jgi:hypothetical protein
MLRGEAAPAGAGKCKKMNKAKAFGWALSLIGSALWIYGYVWGGAPSFIDWPRISPSWVSEFLPNLPCEIGLAISCISMVPLYWPTKLRHPEKRKLC